MKTGPAAVLETDQAAARFGSSVGPAGDVNGDGYDDVVVGSNFYNGVRSRDGGVWVFPGTATGVATTPLWHETGVQSGAEYGWSARGAGDVNGDGNADLIVGAWMYDNGEIDEGRAFVYHGPLSMTTSDCP